MISHSPCSSPLSGACMEFATAIMTATGAHQHLGNGVYWFCCCFLHRGSNRTPVLRFCSFFAQFIPTLHLHAYNSCCIQLELHSLSQESPCEHNCLPPPLPLPLLLPPFLRQYCSNRLRTLHRKLKFTHGRHKFVARKLEPTGVKEVRHLHIPLIGVRPYSLSLCVRWNQIETGKSCVLMRSCTTA